MNEVVTQLEDRVREHAAWIETNGTAQLRAYTDFVAARQSSGDSGSSAGVPVAPPPRVPDAGSSEVANGTGTALAAAPSDVHLDTFQGQKPQSLTVLADLDTQAIVNDLETRVRDVVRS